jgi:ATP-binding cassette subfamily G (WHITE) protein 2 (SNQ2)
MSLYQASELNAKYFHKVLVVNSGREIYFGPVSNAKEYFEALGFYCPPSTTLPDFLTSMSGDPSSRSVRKDFKGQVPLSAEDFERAFKLSRQGVALKADAKTLPQSSKPISLKGPSQKYFVPFHKQVYECTIRHFRINFTDRTTWVAEATGTLVQALMLGTLFFNQQSTTLGLYTRGSAIFFCVLIMGLQASAEFGNTFAQRPILLKHNALRFYRPSAYALGQIFADIPWKVVFVCYNLPIYWMVNLQRSAGHFFIWLFALYMTMMALGVVFRSIAVFTITPGKAILPVGLMLNILIIYTGFYVTPPGMKVWLSWIRYLNPMYYGFESVMLNEIASSSYGCSTADIVPTGAGFSDSRFQSCALSGSSPGDLLLKGAAYIETFYDFRDSHLWRNVGINAGFFLFFSVLVAIGMEGFKVPAGQLATVFFSKEPVAGGDRSTDIEKANSDVSTEAKKYQEADASHRSIGKPPTFSWKQLSLDVDVAGEKKRILHDISGYLAPGSSTALMGLSGAGKTTLLHELSQRGSFGVLTGKMFLDDGPLPRSMRRRSGFVHQQDIHLGTSTVREALQLSAYLRQPADVPKADKDAYVETVLSMLGIESIADALIGVPGSGLDLEQRKRLSIGVELAAKPDLLLFLDEPTSGLDANSAMSIIRLLRKLSDLGQTVLCTIHQPSAELMDYFDNLLLLVPGGKTAYFGPLGAHCESAKDYFARHAPRCGPEENPAEYLLDQTVNPEYDWSQVRIPQSQNFQVAN